MNTIISNPCQMAGLPFLNIAATCSATHTLGPGLRAAVWVQGCIFDCPGCVSPDWKPLRIARLISSEELVEELLALPNVSGLTFSGGEPMLQAKGLAELARIARRKRDMSIICFSGFTLEELQQHPPGPGVSELLAEIDVLIDGPYIQALNDNRGLRGSTNQRIHYLTDKIKEGDYNFEGCSRQAELHVGDGYAMLVGIPPSNLAESFRDAVDQANKTLLFYRNGGLK